MTELYGHCVECGQFTPLLLAPRFPHFCRACLFPPSSPRKDQTADPPAELRDINVTLYDRLFSFKGQGRAQSW